MLASSQRRWWNPNQSPRTCQTEAWRLRGSASRLRRLSFPSSTCKCFMSRWVGVYTNEPNPVVLFNLHLYPAFSSWDACRHAPRASPVCAVKGQTETRAHCELIPVKCLLCLRNQQPHIMSEWESAQLGATKGKVLENFISRGKWKLIGKRDEFAPHLHWSWLTP